MSRQERGEDDPCASNVEIWVLGDLVVLIDGRTVEIAPGHQRRLLTTLAAVETGVSDQTLLAVLWPLSQPDHAIASLRNTVSRLRSGIHPDLIDRTADGYRLASGVRTDVAAFGELVESAAVARAHGDDVEAARRLSSALDLQRGIPLIDADGVAIVGQAVSDFDHRRRNAEDQWSTLILRAGPSGDDVRRLESIALAEPDRERRWEHLAVALDAVGRRREALATLQRARSALADFGLVPGPELQSLERTILGSQHDDDFHVTIIGRRDELGRLRQLLVTRQVVTIVGLGGVGKTHLARELCRRPHPLARAVFVDLRQTSTRATVESCIAAAFGFGQGELAAAFSTTIRHVVDEPTLVVLDNCEQITDIIIEVVKELRNATPDVSIVVTSRVPVGLDVETVLPLSSLSTYGGRLEPSMPSDALTLLASLTPDLDWARNHLIGEQIVDHVGGLPLAIVLASRLLHAIQPAELLDELVESGPLTTLEPSADDDTTTSIGSIVSQTLARLPSSTERLLSALEGIPGKFDLLLAAALVPDLDTPGAIALQLNELVDAGLVERDRESGLLAVAAVVRSPVPAMSAAAETATRRMWAHLAARMINAGSSARGHDQEDAIYEIERLWPLLHELVSVRIADSCLGHAVDVATSLAPFWFLTGRWGEGPMVLRALLDDPRMIERTERARLVAALAEATGTYASTAALAELLDESIAVLTHKKRTSAEDCVLATCHAYAASGSLWRGQRTAFRAHVASVEQLAEQHPLTHLVGLTTTFVGLSKRRSDPLEMQRLLVEARRLFIEIGDRGRAANVMLNLGSVHVRHANLNRAETALHDSLELADHLPMRSLRAHVAFQLAQIAMLRKDTHTETVVRSARRTFVEIGDIGCLNGCNRLLAEHLVREGDDSNALRALRDSLDAIKGVDEQELGLSLLEVASIYVRQGRLSDAAIISSASRSLATGTGIGLNERQQERIDELASTLEPVELDLELAIALALT